MNAGLRHGLPAALLAAVAYALLELAFVAERNLLLPWKGEHASLGALFFAIHGAVALAALFAAHFVYRPSVPFAPAAVLLAIHAVTAFRERTGVLPRDLAGTLVTAAILAGILSAAGVLGWMLRTWPERAARAGIGAGVVLLAAGALRLTTVRPPAEAVPSPPRPASEPLVAADTGQRVLVFGFDGATWDVLDPMMAAGELPHLAALAARGRTFAVETISPTFSPVIWTTVATGTDRLAHGIHDVVQTVMPGGVRLPRSIARTAFLTKTTGVLFRGLDRRRLLGTAPYRSSDVRTASLFEAASEAGLSTSLIEWYVTWPAVPLTGVTVSDRFHLREAQADLPGLVHPPGLQPVLAEHVVDAAEIPLRDVLDLVDLSGLDDAGMAKWASEHERFVREMRLNLARDRTTRNVAVDLLSRDAGWKLFAVYFRAVDLSHHLTWRFHRGEGGEGEPLRSAVRRYHRMMDGIVGEVLARVPEGTTVLLLSDHGFEDVFDHRRAPDGVAILAGGVAASSTRRDRMSVYDVAPTMGAVLGLPAARDQRGVVRGEWLVPGFVETHAALPVATWLREDRSLPIAGADAQVVEAEELERLRALGYIE